MSRQGETDLNKQLRLYMSQKDQDGYYAKKCHIFFNSGV